MTQNFQVKMMREMQMKSEFSMYDYRTFARLPLVRPLPGGAGMGEVQVLHHDCNHRRDPAVRFDGKIRTSLSCKSAQDTVSYSSAESVSTQSNLEISF
jgi:hypothetical protein